MRLDKFLLGFVMFSLIVLTFVYWVQDTNTLYEPLGVNMSTDDFTEVYDTINETYDISQSMKSQTIDGDISETDSWESMTKGSYSAVRLIRNTYELSGDIINALAKKYQVPDYFIKFALTALAISIIFAIIYLVMRVIRD